MTDGVPFLKKDAMRDPAIATQTTTPASSTPPRRQ
jgi:hypothetical protein